MTTSELCDDILRWKRKYEETQSKCDELATDLTNRFRTVTELENTLSGLYPKLATANQEREETQSKCDELATDLAALVLKHELCDHTLNTARRLYKEIEQERDEAQKGCREARYLALLYMDAHHGLASSMEAHKQGKVMMRVQIKETFDAP